MCSAFRDQWTSLAGGLCPAPSTPGNSWPNVALMVLTQVADSCYD